MGFLSFVGRLFSTLSFKLSSKAKKSRLARLRLETCEDRTVPTALAALLTDQSDYAPGATAVITGSLFDPNEVVTLQVVHDDGLTGGEGHEPWTVTADANGDFTTTWYVNPDDSLGATFILTAAGDLGSATSTTFTDGAITGVAVAAQSGTATYGSANSVTFDIDVSSTGPGSRNWSLAIGTLPTGVSAAFSPPSGTNTGGPTDSVLTLTTTGTGASRTLPGSYPFTVTVTAGAGTTGGPLSATGTLVVGKKGLTVTGITANNKVYDGNTTATLNTSSTTLVGVVSGDTVALNTVGSSGAFNNKDAGTAKAVTVSGLTLSGAEATRYTLTQPTGLTANITPRAITGSITAANKVYDGTTTATITSRTLTGIISGDIVNYTGGGATFDNKNVGTGKTVTAISMGLGGADKDNYTVNTTASTTADITPRALVISATGVNKVYDGTTAATVTLTDDRVSGDVFTDSYTSATFSDKNVGTGKTVSVTGILISGPDAGNYTFNTTASTSADITALQITGSFTAANKVYDGNTTASVLTRSLSGTVSGDDVSLTGGTATFSDKNVGINKTVTLSGATLSGADAGNYVLDSVDTTTANISALHITGGFTAANKVFDGNTSATVTSRFLVGAISGDAVSLTGGTATFSDKNVGINKTVTLSGATLSGADAGNYVLDSVATTTATITPKALGVDSATTQSALNVAKQGILSIRIDVAESGIANSQTVADLFNGALFSLTLDGNTYSVEAEAVVIDGIIYVNFRMDAELKALLAAETTATSAKNAPVVALTVDATSNDGNYTLDATAFTRLFNSIK